MIEGFTIEIFDCLGADVTRSDILIQWFFDVLDLLHFILEELDILVDFGVFYVDEFC